MSDAGTDQATDAAGAPRKTDAESPNDPESAEPEVESAEAEVEPAEPEIESVETHVESIDASDAFEALGNEVRMAVLRALVDDSGERVAGRTATFSELFEASPADTTAGFAYHLRQLTDQFLRKTGEDEDRYALTYAGLQVARAMVAGTYTDRVSFEPIPTGDDCPLCRSGALHAACEDNYVTVACPDCAQAILTLPFPPGAHRKDDPERLLAAFDRHHRHRLSSMSDGTCPECAAAMDAELAYVPEAVTADLADADSSDADSSDPGDARRAQARLDCEQCGCRLHCPVTLAVLEHPAVVALYHDHGENVRDHPIWNVGDEWRERVVSDDPWCVRVSARLDEEVLDVFVAEDLTVAGTRQRVAADARQAS